MPISRAVSEAYHDTPEAPVAEMRYVDRTVKAGEKHTPS